MTQYLKDGDKLWSVEAEAAVLAAMILDKKYVPDILAIITRTEMLYKPEHQTIFDCLCYLFVKQLPLDAIALRTELKDRNQLQRIGGVSYLAQIMDTSPGPANATYYARIVVDRFRYRTMIGVIQKINTVPDEPGDVDEQILQLHTLALQLQPQAETKGYRFEDGITNAVTKMVEKDECLPTGFRDLDRLIGGFYPWELIVLAARPGMGKSTMMQDISLAVGKAKKSVVIFSLEMSNTALIQRAISATARVNTAKWHQGQQPPQDEYDEVCKAAGLIAERDITIYETVETPTKMHAIAAMHQRTGKLDLICIDNLQIMTTEGGIEKEYARLSEITRRLKRSVMDLKVPILLVCHLNRQVESRNNHRPRLADLRGSGTIEQDADVVLLLHREDQYRKITKPDLTEEDLDGDAELTIAKNRRGPTGIVHLTFREEFTVFANRSKQGTFEEVEE